MYLVPAERGFDLRADDREGEREGVRARDLDRDPLDGEADRVDRGEADRRETLERLGPREARPALERPALERPADDLPPPDRAPPRFWANRSLPSQPNKTKVPTAKMNNRERDI